jgi:hypothetical protein
MKDKEISNESVFLMNHPEGCVNFQANEIG